MDNVMNEDYLNTVFEGDYANHGASVFEPLADNAARGYRNLAARGAPYSAMGPKENLHRVEMAGSFGGQMPTADALENMNRSLGFTEKRYGATAPDSGSVEAIASRNIDRMGLMAENGTPTPGKRKPALQQIEEARQKGINDAVKRMDARMAAWDTAASSPAKPAWQEEARAKLAHPGGDGTFNFMQQLASSMGKERFEKLVKELSTLTAKIPAEIARSKKPVNPTVYLEHISGFPRNKR